jgi:DNA-binding transcriptional MerR regulator
MINLTIGQLAKETGVSVDTIRYYEKIGLLEKAKEVREIIAITLHRCFQSFYF